MPEQGRPARRRARAGRRGGRRAARRAGRAGATDQRQDRRGRDRRARRADRARAAAQRRPRRAAAGADLRLRVRPVPRRDRLHPRGRRHVHEGRGDRGDAGRDRGRDRRHRLLHAADDVRRGARPRRGRVPDHRDQGRHQAARRRHADRRRRNPRRRAAPGLPRGQADGLLRAVPDRLRRLSGPARRAREADAQRRRAELGAGDLRRARVRLPLRVPRPAAHGHRPRAPRARVRPRAAGDDAERRVRGDAHRRHRDARPQPERLARPRPSSPRSASRTSAPRS